MKHMYSSVLKGIDIPHLVTQGCHSLLIIKNEKNWRV